VTTTPLQSLVLLNDPQFVEAARRVAERALTRFPADAPARHRMVFRTLIGRSPDAVETGILARLFDEQRGVFIAAPADARRLLAVGESRVDEALPADEVAATAMVVSAIMNFDEFVMVR
jgi:hypothetical protein